MLNPRCPVLSYFEYMPFSRRLLLAIMCKHNVIHKTRSTQQIPTPTLSNMRQTFGEDVTLGFRDMLADNPAAKRHAPPVLATSGGCTAMLTSRIDLWHWVSYWCSVETIVLK